MKRKCLSLIVALRTAARREVKLSGHLAACILKAHGTATGEAWCRPALWSRTVALPRGGPRRVGWPKDLGRAEEKAPSRFMIMGNSLCLFGPSFPTFKNRVWVKFACAIRISGMVGIGDGETIS